MNDSFRYLNVGLPEDILRRKMYGDLKGAIRLIDRRLSMENTPEALKMCMIAQKEMMLRTPADYPYSKEEALAVLRDRIPDFSEEEFDERVDAGKIGWIYIDGQMRFFNRFFQTMCKAEPAFALRAGIQMQGVESAGKGTKADGLLDRCIRQMKEEGSKKCRITIRASVKVKDELFEKGMFVRVHLPLPARCAQQSEITIDKVYPQNGKLAPEDAPQRTVCWEENLEENHEFYVEYSYVNEVIYQDVYGYQEETEAESEYKKMLTPGEDSGEDETCIREIPGLEAEDVWKPYLQEEAPHIIFTPYIKELAGRLAKGAATPLEKARRFYDFISLNMKYTFMPAYFGLENIAENCARNFTGDCGVFALLYLTLCRCVGIPAAWQSGLTAEPGFCGGHDWVRIFVEPFGWVFVDTSYGTAAVRAENEQRRQFYFGNLDPYRMIANSAFQAAFTIDKDFWRADPYDNQVGEIETHRKGLTYEEYERSKEVLLCQEI